MKPRLDPFAAAPAAMQSWLDFGNVVLKSGLEDSLMELVKIRASQRVAEATLQFVRGRAA